MRLINRLFLLTVCVVLFYRISPAQEEPPQYLFKAEVNENGVNIRSDSTTSAEIICQINKGERLYVISKIYDWYKIRLPLQAPSFIKKDFVDIVQGNSGKIMNDNVNVRLRPDISSTILGRVNKDESVNILGDSGEWYRIEPVKNSSGWIHSMFVENVKDEPAKPPAKNEEETPAEDITVEGIIKPKTITHIATHKLISPDNKIYLLISCNENLSSFNKHKIRVTGKIKNPAAKNPLIEVEKIEALN